MQRQVRLENGNQKYPENINLIVPVDRIHIQHYPKDKRRLLYEHMVTAVATHIYATDNLQQMLNANETIHKYLT